MGLAFSDTPATWWINPVKDGRGGFGNRNLVQYLFWGKWSL